MKKPIFALAAAVLVWGGALYVFAQARGPVAAFSAQMMNTVNSLK